MVCRLSESDVFLKKLAKDFDQFAQKEISDDRADADLAMEDQSQNQEYGIKSVLDIDEGPMEAVIETEGHGLIGSHAQSSVDDQSGSESHDDRGNASHQDTDDDVIRSMHKQVSDIDRKLGQEHRHQCTDADILGIDDQSHDHHQDLGKESDSPEAESGRIGDDFIQRIQAACSQAGDRDQSDACAQDIDADQGNDEPFQINLHHGVHKGYLSVQPHVQSSAVLRPVSFPLRSKPSASLSQPCYAYVSGYTCEPFPWFPWNGSLR